jgi:hypothetical protein
MENGKGFHKKGTVNGEDAWRPPETMRQHDEARGKTSNTSTDSSNAPGVAVSQTAASGCNSGDEPRRVAETCSSPKE